MNTPPNHLSEKAADATPAWPSPCNKQRSDRRRVRREEDSYQGNGRSALRALIQLGEIQVEHIEGHQAKEQQRKHENRPRDYGALDLAIRFSVVLHPNPRNVPREVWHRCQPTRAIWQVPVLVSPRASTLTRNYSRDIWRQGDTHVPAPSTFLNLLCAWT